MPKTVDSNVLAAVPSKPERANLALIVVVRNGFTSGRCLAREAVSVEALTAGTPMPGSI